MRSEELSSSLQESMENNSRPTDLNGNELYDVDYLHPQYHQYAPSRNIHGPSIFNGSSESNKFARSLSLSASGNRTRAGLDHRGSLPIASIPPSIVNEVPVAPNGTFSSPTDIDGQCKFNQSVSICDKHSNLAQEAHVNLAYELDKEKLDDLDPRAISLRPTYIHVQSKAKLPDKQAPDDDYPYDPVNLVASKIISLVKSNVASIKFILFLLYNLYLVIAIKKTWKKSPSCCEGVKFLVLITSIVYATAIYYLVLKKLIVKPIYKRFLRPITRSIKNQPILQGYIRIAAFITIMVLFVLYTIYLSRTDNKKIISACGIFIFIGISYLLSVNRPAIQWSQVIWGITLQFLMANLVLKTQLGKSIFQCIGDKIVAFLNFTDEGSKFVFGSLVNGISGTESIFAFKVLPIIIFFSFTVSVLYYYGIMQIMVIKLGWLLQITVGSTACESLAAAGNIFLGMTETPLMIKPYLSIMTQSELFAVMTEGFSTIAGSVLAAYINFGINASHLLSASVMAAPASLGIAKLIFPETSKSKTKSEDIEIEKSTDRNALEAGVNGAAQTIKLVANIAANLIALLAFIKCLNSIVSWFASLINLGHIDFTWLLSRLFIPLAWAMGVEWQDTEKVASLLGLKTFLNEFVAYTKLAEMKNANELSDRSQVIATFALCGFSNICAIGIQMGGIGSLIPHRKSELASMAVRAMIAGSIVTFISASMAGLLYTETITNVSDHFQL
ncbi:sodium/nucleoside cotransporter 2 [Tetranychus urticae]|uniref:Sodium/nucleoside cotransporter n=1 Tax=Tetranychus urticae TaxID=32264 RepID=T1KZ47_TETUR|nr:sodium/nucleoside cotransporter 2 [Tetranychus urticae]